MSNLEFKPQAAGQGAADRHSSAPALDHAAHIGGAGRDGHGSRSARRRYGVPRLAHPTDDGFHLFRVD